MVSADKSSAPSPPPSPASMPSTSTTTPAAATASTAATQPRASSPTPQATHSHDAWAAIAPQTISGEAGAFITRPIAASDHVAIFDSGASEHYTPRLDRLSNVREISPPITVSAANGTTFLGTARGDLAITLTNGSQRTQVVLRDAVYASGMSATLISLGKLNLHGYEMRIRAGSLAIHASTGAVCGIVPRVRGLYRLGCPPATLAQAFAGTVLPHDIVVCNAPLPIVLEQAAHAHNHAAHADLDGLTLCKMLNGTETSTDEGEQEIPDLESPPPSPLPSQPSSPPPPPPTAPSAPADAAPDAAQPAASSPNSRYTGRRAHTRYELRLAKLRSVLMIAHFTVSLRDPTAFFRTLHDGTTEMLTIKADDMLLIASRTGSLDTTAGYLRRLVREIFGCVTVTEVNPALRLVRFALPRRPPTLLRARDPTRPTALLDALFARNNPRARVPSTGHPSAT
jgi:hypothetical protein